MDGLQAVTPGLGVLLWGAGIAVLAGTGVRSSPSLHLPAREIAMVVILVGTALIVRLLRLSSSPPILSGNEASLALSALEFADGIRSNPFNTAWASLPSLYPFLLSFPLDALGRTVFSLRMTSVLAGTLTVATAYAYARLAFDRHVALFSGLTLALLSFHVHFSRLGLNNVWDGLLAGLLALTLSLAWRARRLTAYLLPGVVLGVAQFFYFGSRVFFVLVPIWAISVAAWNRKRTGTTLAALVIVLGAALAIFLPLALFYISHPGEYFAPWVRVSVFGRWWFAQTVQFGDPWWWVAAEQLLRGMLGIFALPLTQFFSGQPVLPAPLAILFLVGLVCLLRRLREPDVLWLGLWLTGTVLTVALSTDAPASQRYVNASIAICVTVALGIDAATTGLSRLTGGNKTRFRLVAASLLSLALVWQLAQYFGGYAAKETLADFNRATAVSATSAIKRALPVRRVYFFVSPRLALATNDVVRFVLPGLPAEDVPDLPQWQVTLPRPGRYVFLFLVEREASLSAIRGCVPGGTVATDSTEDGYVLTLTYTVDIPRRTVCVGP